MPRAAWWSGVAALCAVSVSRAKVLINELHYDNVGADGGEFVEIAMLASELADANNILYHEVEGSSGDVTFGKLDVTKNVGTDGVCSDNGAGLVFCVLAYTGIENGRTGFALVRTSGEVLDAVAVGVPGSGTGTSLAIKGAAGTTLANTVFREIGQEAPDAVPVGQSLQLTDLGFRVQARTPFNLNAGESSSAIGPVTAAPTTGTPSTGKPSTGKPTTGKPTTPAPSTTPTTTLAPSTAAPTPALTAAPTTGTPTSATAEPTTAPTTAPTTPAPTQLLTAAPTTTLTTRAPTALPPVQAAPGGAAVGGAAQASGGGPDMATVIAGVLGGSVLLSVGVAMMSAKKRDEFAVGPNMAGARYGVGPNMAGARYGGGYP
jgi:hypothetical protein